MNYSVGNLQKFAFEKGHVFQFLKTLIIAVKTTGKQALQLPKRSSTIFYILFAAECSNHMITAPKALIITQ